ncbi:MAG: hypothetical protein IPG16_11260 [Comamonadaceae bacterium]|nr:hypothetical protein [Comamonadaceae bacterium]
MKRLFIALMLISSAAGATVIDRYATELDVHADGGSRAMVTLDLKNCQAGRFVLPVGFGGMGRLEVQAAPDGVVLNPVPGKESSTLEIELPSGIAASTRLRFAFFAPDVLGRPKTAAGEKAKAAADTQLLRHTFVNTGALEIGVYELSVQLPGDLRVQKIAEQLPRTKRSEVLPRVRLDRTDDRQGADLQLANMKQGDRTSMVLNVVSARHSYGWLLAGLALSLAYLVGFRSLVKAEPSPESQSAQPS